MSYYGYDKYKELREWAINRQIPFYSIIMYAMERADTNNAIKLSKAFPETWKEISDRYNSPGGVLKTDPQFVNLDLEEIRQSLLTEDKGDD